MSPGISFRSVTLPRRIRSVKVSSAPAYSHRQPSRSAPTAVPNPQQNSAPPIQQGDPTKEVVELLQEIRLSIQDLHGKQRQSLEELQLCAIELATSAASWLTGVAIEQDQVDVASLVRRAVDRLGLNEAPICTLHPQDLTLLMQRVGEQAAWLEGVHLKADPSLSRGSCRIENSTNSLISSVSDRLDEIRRIWVEELDHAQIERRSSAARDRGFQRVPDRRNTA